jgi:hypothetical protein
MADPTATWAALAAHIERRGGSAVAVALSGEATTCSGRGLETTTPVPEGGLLIRLPWALALTPGDALAPGGAAQTLLSRPGRARLAGLLASEGDPGPLPPPGPSSPAATLLLALGLLADFRGAAPGQGPRGPYARLLPTPPGPSRLAAAAPAGPAATDLLLFSERELSALASPALAATVRLEAARLAALHAALWPLSEGSEPTVSLGSFTWAHALVRSRALDLGGVGLALLPGIDLAQHESGRTAPPALFLRFVEGGGGDRVPVAVDLVARCPYPAPGTPVCLDYGRRVLRDMLRTYAFVPGEAVHGEGGRGGECAPPAVDVFEDWVGEDDGGPAGLEALVIDGGVGGGGAAAPAWLVEVRVLAAPGADPALLGGTARVAWVVRREPSDGGGAPRIVINGVGAGDDDPTGGALSMQPDAEEAAAGRLSEMCKALAARLGAEGGNSALPPSRASSFFAREHARLAQDYVSARVALLEWAAAGLMAQAGGWLK